MEAYLALQIRKGYLSYREVIEKFPQYKEAIDADLIAKGFGHLIEEV